MALDIVLGFINRWPSDTTPADGDLALSGDAVLLYLMTFSELGNHDAGIARHDDTPGWCTLSSDLPTFQLIVISYYLAALHRLS